MPDSLEMPRSNNPNALHISYLTHIGMKASFAGVLLGAMLYGMPAPVTTRPSSPFLFGQRLGVVVVLFFQERFAQSNQLYKGRRQVATRSPHSGHVLVCHSVYCNKSQLPIRFLRR